MYQNIKRLSEDEKFNWLRLSRTQNVGSSSFFNLLKIFKNVDNVLDNLESYVAQLGTKKVFKICDEKEVFNEIKQCHKIGARIIAFPEPEYPKILREIPSPPPIITVLGNMELLNKSSIAIVGSRNASANGCIIAKRIANELGKENIIIVSGLARGIDAAAHRGSIDTGTIAVIAGGIDNIYPKENTDLYKQIAEKGIIISESTFGSPPKSSNFPRRNRIVSGLSLGVLVVEATLKSGSLITARCAAEQSREVFAIPGSPLDPRYQGNNRLIKQGAILVESADDIMREIGEIKEKDNEISENTKDDSSVTEEAESSENVTLDDREVELLRNKILCKISLTPVPIQEIVEQLNIDAQIVNIVLMQLELAGEVNVEYGRVTKVYSD